MVNFDTFGTIKLPIFKKTYNDLEILFTYFDI